MGKTVQQIMLATQGSFEKFGRKSKREQFLETMEKIVPWTELMALIEPCYPKACNGRQPVGLSIMLRIYFCSGGSISPILEPRMHCTSRRCLAIHGR
jgi:hypothetical protein